MIFVNQATRYNWRYGLTTFPSQCILSAIWLFRTSAGSLAKCFYLDCDSNSLALQLANNLLTLTWKWKIMDHMGCSYLTEKQMPQTLCFYATTHAAQMMIPIPGKYFGCIALPFSLLHNIGHDKYTWIHIFLLC
jgi:hypothetical protein